MSKPILVCCDEVKPGAGSIPPGDSETVEVRMRGGSPNLRVRGIETQLLKNLRPICNDLLSIASYVYAADRRVRRGGPKDIGGKWKRDFRFFVPVQCPDIWTDSEVIAQLEDMLAFLSDDHYTFSFTQACKTADQQRVMDFANEGLCGASVVSLFSGGLDSLAGVVGDVVRDRERPILVSHWPLYLTRARQNRLVKLLRERFSRHTFPHVRVLVHLIGNRNEKREPTQRSRSFLYLSLATIVALELGIQRIRVYENGIVALNLPFWQQSVGAMDTRTVHPKFIRSFERLMSRVTGAALSVENPFFFKTRADVAEVLGASGVDDLIEATTSCSRVRWMSDAEHHCGVCSQCVDRRFSLAAAGLAHRDPAGIYQNDILTESFAAIEQKRSWRLSKARAIAVGYVRSAVKISELTESGFLEEYPEVYDAALCFDDPEKAVQDMFELQRRQSEGVLEVLGNLICKHRSNLARGSIPADSLVGLVAAQAHLGNDLEALANTIGSLLSEQLPIVFQSHRPANEREVQDACESILKTSGQGIEREFPQHAYAVVVSSKPDFSAEAAALFIEVKYPRKPGRTVRRIVDEINSRILEYLQSARAVLFIVYDYHRMIPDRRGFRAQFEKHDQVYAKVIV